MKYDDESKIPAFVLWKQLRGKISKFPSDRFVARFARENRYKIAPTHEATYRSEFAIPESRFSSRLVHSSPPYLRPPCVARLDVANECRGRRSAGWPWDRSTPWPNSVDDPSRVRSAWRAERNENRHGNRPCPTTQMDMTDNATLALLTCIWDVDV